MNKKPKFPEAVFFDWDGTLVDSYSFLEAAHNNILNQLNRAPMEEGAFLAYFGQPRQKVYEELYQEQAEQAQELFEHYVSEHHRQIKPETGAEELLQALDARNVLMGVVTNKKGSFVRNEIRHLGWASFMAAVVASGETAEDKPAPVPLLGALDKAGFKGKKANVWYVGDTALDVECARRAGCIAAFIGDQDYPQSSSNTYQPDLLFKNLAELKAYLFN